MSINNQFAEFADRVRGFIQASVAGRTSGKLPFLSDSEAQFNQLALDLFALQYEHNPAFHKFCEARNATPPEVTHWRLIPAVPVVAFKELELTTLPAGERTAVFHSSGTTGHRPSRHFHDPESLALYEMSLLAWFKVNLGIATVAAPGSSGAVWKEPEPAMILLTPSPELAPHSSLVHMLDTIRRERLLPLTTFVGCLDEAGAWALDFEQTVPALDRTRREHRPVVIIGTAFNFVHLLDHLAAMGKDYHLPTGSRVMETGGYKGRSRILSQLELHTFITRQLGIPASHIVCEYGMCELSSQAYDHAIASTGQSAPSLKHPSGLTRRFQFPPWARGQLISPETGSEVADGETGLIRVVDLANVRSILAVQTEDLGRRCGSGFELLGRATTVEPRGCSLMATELQR